jgi:hypothetical protein
VGTGASIILSYWYPARAALAQLEVSSTAFSAWLSSVRSAETPAAVAEAFVSRAFPLTPWSNSCARRRCGLISADASLQPDEAVARTGRRLADGRVGKSSFG